eukprot:SAG11_NODE_22202_length_410_cov_0.848875_2_plen_47_part_01
MVAATLGWLKHAKERALAMASTEKLVARASTSTVGDAPALAPEPAGR